MAVECREKDGGEAFLLPEERKQAFPPCLLYEEIRGPIRQGRPGSLRRGTTQNGPEGGGKDEPHGVEESSISGEPEDLLTTTARKPLPAP